VKNLGGINAPFYLVGSDSTKKLIPGFEGKEWISTKNNRYFNQSKSQVEL